MEAIRKTFAGLVSTGEMDFTSRQTILNGSTATQYSSSGLEGLCRQSDCGRDTRYRGTLTEPGRRVRIETDRWKRISTFYADARREFEDGSHVLRAG